MEVKGFFQFFFSNAFSSFSPNFSKMSRMFPALALNINANSIACMGFGCGGHLVGLLCTQSELEPHPLDDLVARFPTTIPAKVVYAYPLVSLLDDSHATTYTQVKARGWEQGIPSAALLQLFSSFCHS